MTALPKHTKMTVDEFLAWADTQDGRWELFDGVPMAMAPERVIHGRVKYRVARALEGAIDAAGLPCQFLLDSVAVRIDTHCSYQATNLTRSSIAASHFRTMSGRCLTPSSLSRSCRPATR
jgi:hypothetical protein